MATCMECGGLFDAVRSTKKYCSSACKQQAYLKRLTVKNDVIYHKPVTVSKGHDVSGVTVSTPACSKPVTLTHEEGSFYDQLSKRFTSYDSHPNVNSDTKNSPVSPSDDKLIIRADFLPVPVNKISKEKPGVTINEDTYHWVIPDFFKRLEDEIFESGNREFLRQHYNYYVKQVTTQWQSVLHKLLVHSYQEGIDEDELLLIVSAMESVIDSIEFESLPYGYPYKNRIKEMAANWKDVVENRHGRRTVFELTDKVKQEIFRMLCEIGDLTKHVPFETLFKDLQDQDEE